MMDTWKKTIDLLQAFGGHSNSDLRCGRLLVLLESRND